MRTSISTSFTAFLLKTQEAAATATAAAEAAPKAKTNEKLGRLHPKIKDLFTWPYAGKRNQTEMSH